MVEKIIIDPDKEEDIADDVAELNKEIEDSGMFLKGPGYIYSKKLDAYVFRKKKVSYAGSSGCIFIPKEFIGKHFRIVLMKLKEEEVKREEEGLDI